jgi:3-hydroxyisobutyrate dehydrogenase-like beta-hydroxyacid dehydrogenase
MKSTLSLAIYPTVFTRDRLSSTTGPARHATLAVRLGVASVAGVDVLDAPVSGGPPATEDRTPTTMVGGPLPVA